MFESDGQVNKPTYHIILCLESYNVTRSTIAELTENKAVDVAAKDVSGCVTKELLRWHNGQESKHNQAMTCLVKTVIGHSVYYVTWAKVLAELQDKETTDLDEVSKAAYYFYYFSEYWKDIVDIYEYPEDALRDTMEEKLQEWVDTPKLRRARGPVSAYVKAVLPIWLDAVVWEHVARKFQGE